MNSFGFFKTLPKKTRSLMGLGLILALVVALPLFIWAIVNLNFNQKEKAASGEPVDITAGEPIIGLQSASVTIVGYMDFTCPHCKSFVDNTLSTILASYPNEVKFVFKDFPINDNGSTLAENAAIAAQCAFAQDKFWEMHDLIYAKQDTLATNDFVSFASQINLDMNLYNICYANRDPLEEILDDLSEGNFKGVQGTPTFFINGRIIEGSQPFSAFKSIIDDELNLTASATPTTIATSQATTQPTATATSTPYVEPEPNSCGGTCGSNYNCKANLYCYQGFCRNPICSTDSDCDCVSVTATPKATATTSSKGGTTTTTTIKKTATPKASPKTTPSYTGGMTLIEKPEDLEREEDKTETTQPENMFVNKYAIYIVAGLGLIVLSTIVYALKKKRDNNIPHIVPPTNI